MNRLFSELPESNSVAKWPLSQKLKPIRFLSVQSHVTRDYVGNSAAVPFLQSLGIHVDGINTCEFASLYVHTGSTTGSITPILDGLEIGFETNLGGGFPGAPVDGLPKSKCSDYHVILSGFTCNDKVMDGLLHRLKILTNRLDVDRALFICDPVLGDWGNLYVPQAMISKYLAVIQHATVITPNHYELGWLAYGFSTGVSLVVGLESCKSALDVLASKLDSRMTKAIVVTSCPADDHLITCIHHIATGNRTIFRYSKKDVNIAGTGDIFAASLSAQLCKSTLNTNDIQESDIEESVLRSLAVTQSVIDITIESVGYATKTETWSCVNVLGDTPKVANLSMNLRNEDIENSADTCGFIEHYKLIGATVYRENDKL